MGLLTCVSKPSDAAGKFLVLTCFSPGSLSVTRTSFDVEAKLREVSRMFEADCARKGLTLRIVLDESISKLDARWVQADPSRLAQALQNFTLNAISELGLFAELREIYISLIFTSVNQSSRQLQASLLCSLERRAILLPCSPARCESGKLPSRTQAIITPRSG